MARDPAPSATGATPTTTTGLNLVHIHTDTGLADIGYGGTFASIGFTDLQTTLLDHLTPLLIGEDPIQLPPHLERALAAQDLWAVEGWRHKSSAPSTSPCGT